MPRGFLREAPSGPYIGNPPVFASANLLSLIAFEVGIPDVTEFDTSATNSVHFQLPGETDVPVAMKAGYRYSIIAQVCVEQSLTTSHLFIPRWNYRTAATGLWASPPGSGSEPVFNGNAVISAASNDVGDPTETNQGVYWNEFLPGADVDALQIALTCVEGVLADAFIRNASCWVAVLERGGLTP